MSLDSLTLLTLSFDDGLISQYELAYPVMREQGLVGVVLPTLLAIGKEGRLSWDHLLELQSQGWEIGSHTVSHRDLSRLPEKELEEELKGSREALREHGIEASVLAYPGGKFDERVARAVSKHYRAGRRTALRHIPLPPSYPLWPYQLPARLGDTSKYGLSRIKGWIASAAGKGAWLGLYWHSVEAIPPHRPTPEISRQEFTELVKFVKRLADAGVIKVITFREGLELLGAYLDKPEAGEGRFQRCQEPLTFRVWDRFLALRRLAREQMARAGKTRRG